MPLGPLSAPMRLSIMQNLAKEENEVWLDAMRTIVNRTKPELLVERFKEFEDAWRGKRLILLSNFVRNPLL